MDQAISRKPRVAVLYHFMHPDDVVSAQHFDDLTASLVSNGWDVDAYPCNRGCRNEAMRYEPTTIHQGVNYKRVWRPPTSQRNTFGRLLNSGWMIMSWTRLAFLPRSKRPDIVLVGTDPVFAVLVALPLKLLSPKLKIAHWCFDLHPEASVVSGIKAPNSPLVLFLKMLLKLAYRKCDVIADLGSCMRERLREYNHKSSEEEITPWALSEPSTPLPKNPQTRKNLFGNAKLGLLYSGNYGEAHSMELIVQLARRLRHNRDIHFVFSIRGSKEQKLREEITQSDLNVSFGEFVPLDQLDSHLGAADIHLACLRDEWTGVAVPSKFLGSLAAGRPVLFSGATRSCIANWISTKKTGWLLSNSNVDQIATELERLAANMDELKDMQTHCHQVYSRDFSKAAMTKRWHLSLNKILSPLPDKY